ncbi:hypothetical protein A9798_15515 [Edwardsiella hoshinae]|uniref:DUF5983 domain-containing protein n=1 Tax=Edwardsiella hoshinae TaxID=93378 RepID=A0ABN4T3T1_9GAMM|nr:DUF5983 family protein [Edwardsiella hoshinae]AOV98217.1 hypothetical protein A9798_15515 [Edwardsiella hoshinae]
MKRSLAVDADAVNVQRHNMARIADVHVDAPFSPIYHLNGIQCSTAHISDADNTLLFTLSHQQEDFGESEWIHFTGTGYLLRASAWPHPVLRLKRLGLSKACRRLVATFTRRYSADIIHLDAAGEVLPGFATFDW